ncbi:Trihelix transcription factor GT-3b [Castilleja foliolosa]|uniref:Trihelix transcription factor GT-3b n=1 Tax=Castilleja foliolosa TaxID=1961234 RepID=A0ABD3BJA0_9LAMI
MDHGHHHHQHHLHHQYSVSAAAGLNIEGGSDNRFPQWSIQETQDFLLIRAEFDPAFMETKRNKLLWELISTRMREKGYNRSAEQCKCKWKNLVTRFKGCESMEAEGISQQFPFYNELQTIFTARMQRMLWNEAEGGGGGSAATSSKKKATAQFSSDDDDENDDISEGGAPKKKRKSKSTTTTNTTTNSNKVINGVREIMDDFMKQQMEIEMQWMKAYEKREEERRVKEMEWRQRMEALENERLMMERRWRERDEQRKIRDEQRAEKRDALITLLLNKLQREDN